ncbi:SLC13 family permease [Aquipuribacter sp. SD81]|uniref:SLC13 family permease n=1 Tax=Aquipuribacter sp. SD81 TaxID=3127703 RepID=UPI003017B41C
MWRWPALLGALALATGVMPLPEARVLAERVGPVLLFLVAVTVLAEVADRVGAFDVVAHRVAVRSRSQVGLFLATAVLATAVTAVLSLDTTAVLLTPVVVAVARRTGAPVVPHAVLVLWLANTASLPLPVSNLTNLLAAARFRELGADPVRVMALPAVLTVVVSVGLLLAVHARRLRAPLSPSGGAAPAADRVLLVGTGLACLGLVVGSVLGVDPAVVAPAVTVPLVVVVVLRAPRLLDRAVLPWRLVLLAAGLFVVVQVVVDRGLGDLLGALAGTTGDAPADLARLAAVAAVASNVVNNLPAYLALEPVAGDPARLAALLVGTDAGPLVTPWASLATLLWWDRCRALGVRVPVGRVVLLGVVGVPLVVASGVLGLVLTT